MAITIVQKSREKSVLKGQRSRLLKWANNIGQAAIALLVCVVLLEGYFKLAGVGGQEFLQPDLQMGCRHIAGKRVIWRLEGFSHDKISSVGLRDSPHAVAKEAGIYRIALLGDSAVESLQVDLNQTFGKVLESLLNKKTAKHYEVINFGCSSYSTGQELRQYEQEVDKYQPDAIVLLYNRGDSVENTYKIKDRNHAEVRPYFYVDTAGQLKQDDSILLANFDKLKPNPVREYLRKNSAIFGVLSQADLSLTLNEPRYRKVKSWWQSIVNLPNKFKKPKEGGEHAKALYADQNDMVVTKALLAKLADEAASKKRKFILAVFPNIVGYAPLMVQAKELKILAEHKNFAYLDLSKSFLADREPHSNFIQYHFSAKGHKVVAQELVGLVTNSK